MTNRKVILLTGASSGIGRASAEYLLKTDHIIYLASRNLLKMKDLEQRGAQLIELDLTKEEHRINAIDQIIREQGRIDVLINNAGLGYFGPVEELDLEYAREVFEVNLFGTARLTQLSLPYMRSQGSGRIINVSSVGGRSYTPFGAWYHASKYALEAFSDCLRLELKAHNIDVVIVEPGSIQTDFISKMMGGVSGYTESNYDPMFKKYKERVESPDAASFGSKPELIGNLISRIVDKRSPRTRYVKGKLSYSFLWLRRLLSDRMYDRLLSWGIS